MLPQKNEIIDIDSDTDHRMDQLADEANQISLASAESGISTYFAPMNQDTAKMRAFFYTEPAEAEPPLKEQWTCLFTLQGGSKLLNPAVFET